jgi:hypothetical protein
VRNGDKLVALRLAVILGHSAPKALSNSMPTEMTISVAIALPVRLFGMALHTTVSAPD